MKAFAASALVAALVDVGAAQDCFANQDCEDSTFCCSSYSCVHPSVCLTSAKASQDFCDFDFECSSQCCTGGICSASIDSCAATQEQVAVEADIEGAVCFTNFDCAFEIAQAIDSAYDQGSFTSTQQSEIERYQSQNSIGCCSQSQCVASSICQHGQKAINDFCHLSSECASQTCSNNLCAAGRPELDINVDIFATTANKSSSGDRQATASEDPKKWQNILVIVSLASFICLVGVVAHCCQKYAHRQALAEANRSSGLVGPIIRYRMELREKLEAAKAAKAAAQGKSPSQQARLQKLQKEQASKPDHDIQRMLQKGAARKLHFTGQKKDGMNFEKKYDGRNQVSTPISEDSAECFQTMMDSTIEVDEYINQRNLAMVTDSFINQENAAPAALAHRTTKLDDDMLYQALDGKNHIRKTSPIARMSAPLTLGAVNISGEENESQYSVQKH